LAQPTRVKLVTVIKPNNRRCNMRFSPEIRYRQAGSIAGRARRELASVTTYDRSPRRRFVVTDM